MTNIQKEKQREVELKDAYNDEHWLKKYGVSLKETSGQENKSISAKIIEAVTKEKHTFAV